MRPVTTPNVCKLISTRKHEDRTKKGKCIEQKINDNQNRWHYKQVRQEQYVIGKKEKQKKQGIFYQPDVAEGIFSSAKTMQKNLWTGMLTLHSCLQRLMKDFKWVGNDTELVFCTLIVHYDTVIRSWYGLLEPWLQMLMLRTVTLSSDEWYRKCWQ